MNTEKPESLCIRPYLHPDYEQFKSLFGVYFRTDFGIDISEGKLEEICKEITQQADLGIIFLDMLLEDGECKGFIIYQIDSPESDWCEKEGYGFIREVYIAGCLRRRGLGAKITAHAENKLRDLGVENIYLTSEASEGFWTKRGYKNTGEVSSINRDPILIKCVYPEAADEESE